MYASPRFFNSSGDTSSVCVEFIKHCRKESFRRILGAPASPGSAKYYRRLPAEMKATVANHDINRMNGHSYLLRGKGEWIRAFLSSEYVAYNNSEIAETVESLLGNGALTMKSFVLEETHMFLKIISEEIWDVESGLKAGIMIGNSEVGMGSVSVEPFVFRKPCTNDLIVSQEKSFRHAHIHLTAYELTRRMAEAVTEGFQVSSSLLDTFLKTREEPIEDPVETIRKIAEARNFPRSSRTKLYRAT